MIYEFNKWLFSRPEVYTPHNDHYSLTSGDPGYWDSWDSSPVFPWSEQPESDKFYIVYNNREKHHPSHFWEHKVYIDYFVRSNNVKLIEKTISEMVKMAGRNEYSVTDFDKWLMQNNTTIEGYTVQDMYAELTSDVTPPEQENGVFGKAVRLCVKLHDC